MFMFLGILGLISLIIYLVLTGVAIVKKNGKAKRNALITIVSLLVFLLGAANTSPEQSIEESPEKAVEEVADSEVKEEVKNEPAEQENNKQEDAPENNDQAIELNDLEVHFIDVGQADAILLEYSEDKEDFHILIDSGDWNSHVAVNYLEQMNVEKLDLLVGTHPHSDHIGQMDTIINELDVAEVWMSGDVTTTQVFERVLNAIDENNVDYNEPRIGEDYAIGPLDIKVVAPTEINGDLNDGSIAFKATYGDISFLFTGDAEKTSEQTMVSSDQNLDADILKLGHHGSDTSSTPEFIEAVDPDVGVMSVGNKNSYGHPSKSVIDRMTDRGVDLYSTKDHGTVIIKTDGNEYDITTKKDGNVSPSSSGGSKSNKANESEKKPDKKETSNNCIDINSAEESEVQGIIHIGPERATELINERPYEKVEDLGKIDGIGESRIKDIIKEGKACVGG